MMVDKIWKRTEREIAKLINGRRIPITGRQRGDVPDIEHRTLSVEVKHRKKLPGFSFYVDALDQAQQAVKDTDKIPVGIFHQEGVKHRNDLVVIALGDFIKGFLDEEGQAEKLKTVWRGLDSEEDGLRENDSEEVLIGDDGTKLRIS